jgi:hypothetical protein
MHDYSKGVKARMIIEEPKQQQQCVVDCGPCQQKLNHQ